VFSCRSSWFCAFVEVEHQGTQLCEDGFCCGVPIVSAQPSCEGKPLLQPADNSILLQDEALQGMAVRHDRARTCQLIAEDIHMDIAGLHELVGGEALACQLRFGSCYKKRVSFRDQFLELGLAAFRVFARVEFPEDGLEVFFESSSRAWWICGSPLGVAAEHSFLQLFDSPASTLCDLSEVGARRHKTDDDRVAKEFQLRVDRC